METDDGDAKAGDNKENSILNSNLLMTDTKDKASMSANQSFNTDNKDATHSTYAMDESSMGMSMTSGASMSEMSDASGMDAEDKEER